MPSRPAFRQTTASVLKRIFPAYLLLEQLVKTCYGEGPVNECPILEALAGDPHETENQHHKGGVT